jgi:transcriptional regulator of acetoin/glycerol metabolism
VKLDRLELPMGLEKITADEEIEENLNLEFMEKNLILKVLNLYNGNISLCARTLGIGRNTLYRKMERYEIKCSEIDQCSNW